MYAYIKGIVAERTTDSIILENNGVGYNIITSYTTLDALGNIQSEIKLYTYLYVREDIFSLYGFLTTEELRTFLLLISVSGVGPKAALSILSALTPSKFSLCIITENVKALTGAQGVGPKLAQRIILELKDKIKKETAEAALDITSSSNYEIQKNKPLQDALEALLVLGYSRDNAFNALKSSYEEGMELEILIKNALKKLSRS